VRSLPPALIAFGFLGIGGGAIAAPRVLAANYGLPVDDPASVAYVRALGVRDLVLGALVATFLLSSNRAALRATIGLSAFVGVADATVVFRVRGWSARNNLAIHALGAVALCGTWMLLGCEDRGERNG